MKWYLGIKPMSGVHTPSMALSDGEGKPVTMVMATKYCTIIVFHFSIQTITYIYITAKTNWLF